MEPFVDNTPVVGHIKACVHILAGDEERGVEILKGATRSTGVIVGAALAGPAGAVSGGAITDGVFTGIDSIGNTKYTPYGLVNYATHIGHTSAGDHVDNLLGIAIDLYAGKVKNRQLNPFKSKTVEYGVATSRKRPFAQIVEIRKNTRNEAPADVLKGPRQRYIYESHISPAQLEMLQSGTGLPIEYSRRLESIDFRRINDIHNMQNCWFCSLGALKRKTVTELARELHIENPRGRATIGEIISVYRGAGLKNLRIKEIGDAAQLHEFLNRGLNNGDMVHFTLAYIYESGGEAGHVVHARSWKTESGDVRLLTTDFQKGPTEINRFSTTVPDYTRDFTIIYSDEVRELGDVTSFGNLL